MDKDFEQIGYDQFLELWANNEGTNAGNCPARWMREGSDRSAYIRGWNRAKLETQKSDD